VAALERKRKSQIRAFEDYANKIYNIDPITGWPHLTAVIPSSYKEELEKAQVDFNFALNLSFLAIILGFECLFFIGKPNLSRSLVLLICCFTLSYVAYNISCSYARWWGEYVRSAFDLYRYDLLKQLGIYLPPMPLMLKQEKEIWSRLQEQTFFVINSGNPDFQMFPHGLKFLPKSSSAKPEEYSKQEDFE